MFLIDTEWILCPVCGSKTRDRLREDTVLKNYPLYCPKCKQETLINAKELHITVIKEPDAQTQSRWTCEVTHSSSALWILKYYTLLLCLQIIVMMFCLSSIELKVHMVVIEISYPRYYNKTWHKMSGFMCYFICNGGRLNAGKQTV